MVLNHNLIPSGKTPDGTGKNLEFNLTYEGGVITSDADGVGAGEGGRNHDGVTFHIYV